MNNILSIYRKELRSYLYSPIPYILIIVFMIITGWFFTTNLFLNEVVSLRGVLDVIPFILLFYIPAISMRTFSEEKKSGTIELLMTKPITEYDVVIGKFLSTITLAAFTFLPTVVYVISLTFLGKLDFGPVISSYLGLLLLAGLYISVGIFSSSLTENQVIAFIISFLIIFALFMINKVLVFVPSGMVSTMEYISSDSHFSNIVRGVIDSRDIVYYLSGIIIMIILTKTSLESRKW